MNILSELKKQHKSELILIVLMVICIGIKKSKLVDNLVEKGANIILFLNILIISSLQCDVKYF